MATDSRSVRPTRGALPAALVYGLAVLVVASVGGLATSAGQGAGGWYADAEKPFFTPPGWVFGPVWTALYVAMALAAWRLSRRREEQVGGPAGGRSAQDARTALRLWWVQLALNFLWTPLFFATELLWVALVDVVLLDVVVALLVVRAWRVDRVAAWLLVPYLVWILFATVLNASIAAMS